MKKLLTILILITVASGCVTQRRCDRKFPPTATIVYRDSIIRETKTIFRDTTVFVYVPPDTVTFTDTVIIKDNQVQVKPSFLKVQYAYSEAYILNNRLHHTLIQNEDSLQVTLLNAIRETWEKAEKHFSKTETKIVKVRYVPLFVKILGIIGVIGILFVSYRIIRIVK